MKTRHFVLIASLLAVGIGAWWIGARPQLKDEARPLSAVPGSQEQPVQQGQGSESPLVRDQRVGSNQLRLGGPSLSLQRVYREGLAARGSDDALLASVVDFSRVMCSVSYPDDDEGWKDPNRRWAMEYLKNACSGFNADDFVYTGTNKNALWYMAKAGDKEAAEAALKDIHRSDNMLEVGVASVFLVERGLFPGQDKYDLPKEDLLKMAVMAGKLRTCGALDACGSDSLITAEVCARVGCKPGTSFAEAVRRDLSPRQYEVMLKMRDAMATL